MYYTSYYDSDTKKKWCFAKQKRKKIVVLINYNEVELPDSLAG